MFIKNIIITNSKFCSLLVILLSCLCLSLFSCKSLDLKTSKAVIDSDDEDDDTDDGSANSTKDDDDTKKTSNSDENDTCYDPDGNIDPDICEIEHLMIELLNKFRSDNGLKTLSNNKALSCAARKHAKDQAKRGTIGHWGFNDHRSPTRTQQLRSCKSDNSSVSYLTAENTAMYPSSSSNESLAKAFTTMWENSRGTRWMPGHRENMLNQNSTYIGIGVAKSGSYYYATQVFGR